MLVVDELDKRKRDHKPIARDSKVTVSTRARNALKIFEGGFFQGGADDRSFSSTGQSNVEVTLWVDDPDRERLADPDSDIVDTALALRNLSGRPLVVVSTDTGMRFRARAAGLKAERPPV